MSAISVRHGFASDNNSGVHPEVMEAMLQANVGHVMAYGRDPYTEEVMAIFKRVFGPRAEPFLAFNGTATNVLAIKALTHSFHAVICADIAHLNVHECGATEHFTGCKLLLCPSKGGKISLGQIARHLGEIGNEHAAQPKVVSITQATEAGTVYTPEEIASIAEFVHGHELFLHMDGARLCNAAVSLGKGLKEITADVGVDALSFGGTKNGAMFAEAVVFFDSSWAGAFEFVRMQGMQLASKMRFMSAQFKALLKGDLWAANARHANEMAKRLAGAVSTLPGVEIVFPVETNAVFAKIPPSTIPSLQEESFFHVWDHDNSIVRWMCSFDTTQDDIDRFSALVRRVLTSVA